MCLVFSNCSPFGKYGGFDFGVDRWFFLKIMEFQSLEVKNPLFSKVVILMVCLFYLKMYDLEYIKSLRFWVTWVSQPNFIFYFGILKWCTSPSFSRVLIVMVCLFFLNCSPFGKYGWFGFRIYGWFYLFIIKFQSLKVTYPLYIWYCH